MRENNVLLDSSVVIAAFTEDHKGSQKILKNNKTRFILPLTLIEVANALKSNNEKEYVIELVLSSLDGEDFRILEPNVNDIISAAMLASKFSTSVYDALYEVMALKHKVTFCTLDKRFYNKVDVLGNIELVN